MAWVNPKTDWHGSVVGGKYVGDFFNAEDFNRLKNNMEHLKTLSVQLYDAFQIKSLGNDRTPMDYVYADEINKIEDNLETINVNTYRENYGEKKVYYDNGKMIDFNELNRIESAMLDIYQKLMNQREGRRTFTWNFGMKEGF